MRSYVRSEVKLVAACCAGDKQAYAQLVGKYYRRVFLVCMGVVGNVHDAEDAAQEALLKGFLEIKQLRDRGQFGAWICRIARNICLNYVRREKHGREILAERAKDVNDASREDGRLEIAIERLGEDLRLALVMYYFDGQSVENVAGKLGISKSGVYLRLREATKQLHELLVKQEDLK